MPPNIFVTTPEEVPVAPCPMEELRPVISYLSTNAPVPNENVKFVRGVVVPVKTPTGGSKGVLDLCKQVVGPEGVTPLLDGLSLCKGVEGLLLGNNVTGSKGAREIAKFIRSCGFTDHNVVSRGKSIRTRRHWGHFHGVGKGYQSRCDLVETKSGVTGGDRTDCQIFISQSRSYYSGFVELWTSRRGMHYSFPQGIDAQSDDETFVFLIQMGLLGLEQVSS